MTSYTQKELQLEALRMLKDVRKANKGNGKKYTLDHWQVHIDSNGSCTCLSVHIKDSDNWVSAHNIAI